VEPIRVNKADLLDVLRENRAAHRDIFLTAQEKYRERIIEELDRRLADAKAGKAIDVYIRLPVPEDHTDDYDRIISMLMMSLDDEILLTERDAMTYVQDEWGWNASFFANTTSYTVA
jgi:hypothetical protein